MSANLSTVVARPRGYSKTQPLLICPPKLVATMNARLLGLALWQVVAVASATEPLACPLSLPRATLSMECASVCPSSLSPCLYYTQRADCVAEPEEDSGSVCVASASEGDCAVECFAPFAADAWFFMVTNGNESKHDVSARKTSDARFQLAKKSVAQLAAISDLSFPSTATTISFSGNALPVEDKAHAATLVPRGEYITINMESVAFLQQAGDATTIMIENINLQNLTVFPLLPKLTVLHLANGGFTSVPTGIAELAALQRLDLSLNAIETIPSGVLPTTLVDLCLQESGLQTIPADVASMTQLKKLNIGGNDFSDAASFASLPASLEHLHLASVSLRSLPTSFSRLTNLRSMSLADNSLDTVETGTLPPSLTLVNLSMNALSSIDEDAFPSTLETLDLRANRLTDTSLPPNLSTLSSLTALYLDDNQLDCIPAAVFTLPRLAALSLHRNPSLQMVTLSTTELASLSQLTTLAIDPSALVTSCDEPQTIGQTNYRVCVTGDVSIKATSAPDTQPQPGPGQDDEDDDGVDHAKERTRKATDTHNKTWWLIIGVSSGVIGFVVLFIIGVLIVCRREALADTAAGRLLMSPPTASPPPDKGSRDSDVFGGRATSVISDLSVIEHADDHEASDATAYREMTSGAVAVTTMARGSSSSSSSAIKSASYSSRTGGMTTGSVEGVTSTTSTTVDGVTVVKKVTRTTHTTTTTKGEAHTSASSAVVASASTHQTQVVERERFPSACEL